MNFEKTKTTLLFISISFIVCGTHFIRSTNQAVEQKLDVGNIDTVMIHTQPSLTSIRTLVDGMIHRSVILSQILKELSAEFQKSQLLAGLPQVNVMIPVCRFIQMVYIFCAIIMIMIQIIY